MADRPALTPSQTVGPFLHLVLPWPDGPDVVPPDRPDAIWLRGLVLDGDGVPLDDALVETWQADEHGRYDSPDFRGFGRSPTDAQGRWAIRTVKPGRVGAQAPHVAVSVFARGLLTRVVTRIYFADETEANDADPVLAVVPVTRRATLLAAPSADGYSFDVRLQGEGETVFFDV